MSLQHRLAKWSPRVDLAENICQVSNQAPDMAEKWDFQTLGEKFPELYQTISSG